MSDNRKDNFCSEYDDEISHWILGYFLFQTNPCGSKFLFLFFNIF